MKTTIKILSFLFIATLTFNGCSDDDDAPGVVNEEEVITTVTISLTPQGGGTTITLISDDPDGPDGPTAPSVTVSGDLAASTTYNGSITFFNSIENEDITAEVEEEDDEHQVFYASGLGTFAYGDADGDGNPIGLSFTFTTDAAGVGTLSAILRHEPDKNAVGVSDGDITNAGGETDVEVTFDIITN